MSALLFLALCAVVVFALAINKAPLWAWSAALVAAAFGIHAGGLTGNFGWPAMGVLSTFLWLPVLALASLAIPQVRRAAVIKPAFGIVQSILPKVSDTEQQALDAGTVGWDAELFSGTPDWERLAEVPAIELTAEEQAFLDGPTQELCEMINDWEMHHNEFRIPDHLREFIAKHKFLGMLISKEHGGLGFSGQAQSLILGKISSASPEVATYVMVPNSLGPGELIEKYGTDEQKDKYLERLALGKELPCFGLTGPTSGSDAAAMRDIGVVTKGKHNGEEVVGITLDIRKRYITLAPDATLIGLAFRLFDPDNLLGDKTDIGITVALLPADHPGVEIGRRHLPSGGYWPNGPISGDEVFIPMSFIIGGEKMIGQGWRMLMECLAAGRAISLPSSSTAGAKAMLQSTSAYARVRKQFGISIGHMDGVEERITNLVERAYVTEASRAVTAAMVSRGEKPSVISALMKYQATELMRDSVNDAMDVQAGKAVCDGPSNYAQSAYRMVPVGITVEGANILTRSLITFAQGALRSHPWLYAEISAAQNTDKEEGLEQFEHAFTNHVSFAVSNVFGALFHNVTFGAFADSPDNAKGLSDHYRQLARGSRNFALVADLTVALLGGGLKVKQKLTGRMADALSELYMISCVLKRFEDDGRPAEDRPIVDYCVQNALFRFQQAIDGTIDNFPVAWARLLMKPLVFPLGRPYKPASDDLGKEVAGLALEPGEVRDRLIRNTFISKSLDSAIGLLEHTLPKVIAAEPIEKKLERAVRKDVISRYHNRDWIGEAVTKDVITEAEAKQMREVEALVKRVIDVDDFAPEELVLTGARPDERANKVKPPKMVQAAE